MPGRTAASRIPALLVACALALPTAARADGAFPDSLGILLPSDQPNRIIATTNFGLLRSDDGGQSFRLVCEEVIGALASLYQQGPAPENRLLAVTADGFSYSTDDACTWHFAQGLTKNVYDAFPDPSDPKHVLAVGKATPTDDGTPRQAVFESHDGAATFASDPFLLGPGGADMTGVEIARSDPLSIYVAFYAYAPPPVTPYLMRSSDGGANFEHLDLGPKLGTKLVRILAIDPEDANKVYLRIYDNGLEEQVGIYDAARNELTIGLRTQYRLSAFLRRADGTLLLGTKEGPAFISHNGGKSFESFPGTPHFRALGERDGVLYAVTDDKLDGYAVAKSTDGGESWQALVSFNQIVGLLDCGSVAERCEIPWQNFQLALSMPSSGDPIPGEPDEADASTGGPKDAGAKSHKKSSSGCGCSLPDASRTPLLGWLALAACAFVVRHAQRRRTR